MELMRKRYTFEERFYEEEILKDGRAFTVEGENNFFSTGGAYRKRHKECKVQSMLGEQPIS